MTKFCARYSLIFAIKLIYMVSVLHLKLKIKNSYSILFFAITLFLCSVNPGLAKTPITNDFLQSIYDQHGNFFVKPNQNSIRPVSYTHLTLPTTPYV